ncbi:MAG: class I SAM-dependent methyltransferase [Armatimonadetes bacterium]|nr:class I SAM-dependent methyltransferase [Armatimonadota bacterium]
MTAVPRMAQQETWSPKQERARLNEISQWYDSRRGLNRELVRRAVRRILTTASGCRALELGCASGVMTEELARRFAHLDVVEGAERYARHARAILDGYERGNQRGRVHHCLFEEFDPAERYDLIVMAWILEHVADPGDLVRRAAEWLVPGGEIHIVVPNAESLHRRVGVCMGLLGRLDELNQSDLAMSHRRVYTWDRLAEDITAAGLRLTTMDGILLKPLPSALMDAYPQELRDAFFELAPLSPRLCSEIYAVCSHPDHDNATRPAYRVR